jgi:HPt (histidine-containing phosphotransfer) domain-containing protein
MLRAFVGDLVAMPDQLDAMLAADDSAAAARLLHTLKGVAATLGAMQLSAVAGQGEKLMAAGPGGAQAAAVTQQAREAIAQAGPKLGALLAALQAATAPSQATNAPIDNAALRAALLSMAGQLQNADMAATDAMAELQRVYGATIGDRLQSLDEAIGALDFERAAALCDTLIEALPA